jgi:hypothetical protein
MLICNRNQRFVIALAFMELPDSSLQAACVRGIGTQCRLQRTSGTLNEQSAQIDIAAQADMSEPCPAARAVLARRQAKPGAELSAISEDLRVGHRGGQRA